MRARVEDAILLWKHGRREGAFLTELEDLDVRGALVGTVLAA